MNPPPDTGGRLIPWKDKKLSKSATAGPSSSVTAHEISNNWFTRDYEKKSVKV